MFSVRLMCADVTHWCVFLGWRPTPHLFRMLTEKRLMTSHKKLPQEDNWHEHVRSNVFNLMTSLFRDFPTFQHDDEIILFSYRFMIVFVEFFHFSFWLSQNLPFYEHFLHSVPAVWNSCALSDLYVNVHGFFLVFWHILNIVVYMCLSPVRDPWPL